jgi:HAMP domain-containing protein
MKRSSLVWKALAIVTLVYGLTMAAVAASSAWRVDRNLSEQFERQGVAIATGFSDASVEVLLFRDVSTIQSMIDQYADLEGVGYVFVVNPQGDVLAHTFVPNIPLEVQTLQGHKNETTIQRTSLGGRGDFIDVSAPILEGEVGYVHVGMNRQFIRAAIWPALEKELLLLGMVFLISLLATSLLMNKIIRPLRKLTDYTNSLARGGSLGHSGQGAGEEVLAISKRADEVGQLAGAFHVMMDQVSFREGELRKAHTELEMRVQERTAELIVANNSLHKELTERQRAEALLAQRAAELTRSNLELKEEIEARKLAEQELSKKTEELEEFNRLAVGREQRMIELKRQVNELARALARPAPYDLAFAEGD